MQSWKSEKSGGKGGKVKNKKVGKWRKSGEVKKKSGKLEKKKWESGEEKVGK